MCAGCSFSQALHWIGLQPAQSSGCAPTISVGRSSFSHLWPLHGCCSHCLHTIVLLRPTCFTMLGEKRDARFVTLQRSHSKTFSPQDTSSAPLNACCKDGDGQSLCAERLVLATSWHGRHRAHVPSFKILSKIWEHASAPKAVGGSMKTRPSSRHCLHWYRSAIAPPCFLSSWGCVASYRANDVSILFRFPFASFPLDPLLQFFATLLDRNVDKIDFFLLLDFCQPVCRLSVLF